MGRTIAVAGLCLALGLVAGWVLHAGLTLGGPKVVEDGNAVRMAEAQAERERHLRRLDELTDRAQELAKQAALRRLGALSGLDPDALQATPRLDLAATRVTDDDLAHLVHLPALRELDLSQTKITDAGLDRLDELDPLPLARLDLSGAAVTRARADRFRDAHPNCNIAGRWDR